MGKIKTSNKLHILVLLFVIGFISLFTVNQVFSELIEELNVKTKSYEKRMKIAEFVSEDIQGLKALFFELAIATNTPKSREIVVAKIELLIENIKNSLMVLEKGGTLKRHIELNMIGTNETITEVSYNPNISGQVISLEVIDIQPKLAELREMIAAVDVLLDKRYQSTMDENYKDLIEVNGELSRYYKTTPAFFNRMSENIKRLLYEGDLELKNIKEEKLQKQDEYLKIRLLLTVSVIVITTLFGFWISQIINKENHQLEVANKDLELKESFVKAILDGQENMVIVSDGVHMVEANEAIANFFDFIDSIEEFKAKYACICELFEKDAPDDSYLTQSKYDEATWVHYMLDNREKNFKVILNNGREDHHFSVVANKKFLDSKGKYIIVIVLNDITSEVKSRKQLADLNDNLEGMIALKTKELQTLNSELEERIQEELEKNREKDKQMIQQSRFAALGEMIGNIAHQWRQPLSAISSTASGVELQMELGIASNDDIKKSYSDIKNYVQFLTQTIEDFRGFFKEDKAKIDFDIRDVLRNTLAITGATYKDNNIDIKTNMSDTALLSHGMPSELSQAFLNILNNARDATIEKKPSYKGVYVYSETTDTENTIYFQDNAGGIPENILEKIFDPYFTTKHQSQGTGIGLYMSKDIVEKNMHGSLSVKNIEQELDGITYKGACFRVSLPRKISEDV